MLLTPLQTARLVRQRRPQHAVQRVPARGRRRRRSRWRRCQLEDVCRGEERGTAGRPGHVLHHQGHRRLPEEGELHVPGETFVWRLKWLWGGQSANLFNPLNATASSSYADWKLSFWGLSPVIAMSLNHNPWKYPEMFSTLWQENCMYSATPIICLGQRFIVRIIQMFG